LILSTGHIVGVEHIARRPGQAESGRLAHVTDDVAQRLRAAWDEAKHWYDDDKSWVGDALRPVITAANARSELRGLFPFTSLNRLCFSRCSEYPYTEDCACIAAKDGEYVVQATWTVSDAPAAELSAVTRDLDVAIQAMIDNLPHDTTVWIGGCHD